VTRGALVAGSGADGGAAGAGAGFGSGFGAGVRSVARPLAARETDLPAGATGFAAAGAGGAARRTTGAAASPNRSSWERTFVAGLAARFFFAGCDVAKMSPLLLDPR
jgi:hypothetical protein